MTAVVRFPFQGDELEVVKQGDRLWVSVRRVCEAVGVDPDGQRTKLREKPWARTEIISARDARGHAQEGFFIDLDSLPMWLATIEPSRVAEDVRAKLVEYQREAARALRDYFFGGVAVNPRFGDAEVLAFRQKAAAELAIMGRDFLAPEYVKRVIEYGIATVQGSDPTAAAGERLVDVGSYLAGKGLGDADLRKKSSRFGKELKRIYAEAHGAPPKKARRFINGSEREVFCYVETDLPLFDAAYQVVFGGGAS